MVSWVDKDGGVHRSLSYEIMGIHDENKGIGITMTITDADGKGDVKEHWFENLAPMTFVLAETPEGDTVVRHVLRVTPTVEATPRIKDYADHVPMDLRSAVVFAGMKYAGRCTVHSEIASVSSSVTGLTIEWGLRPFRDARPIGVCEGNTIEFMIDGKAYKVMNGTPIVTGGGRWNVYVRWEKNDMGGDGYGGTSYAAATIQEALESDR
jgi:hypothetical protein